MIVIANDYESLQNLSCFLRLPTCAPRGALNAKIHDQARRASDGEENFLSNTWVSLMFRSIADTESSILSQDRNMISLLITVQLNTGAKITRVVIFLFSGIRSTD